MIARFATFTFDSDQRLLLDRDQQVIHVTPKAFELLAVLIEAAPRVVTKVELHERVWAGTFVTDTTLASVVKELRRVLGDRELSRPLIRTSHGIGYAFTGIALAPQHGRGAAQHWVFIAGDHRVQLRTGENLIGRDPESAVWLDVRGVSRRHARIIVSPSAVQIEDLGSKNGTVLRGAPLTAAAALRDKDTIRIGPIVLQYRISHAGISTDTLGPT